MEHARFERCVFLFALLFPLNDFAAENVVDICGDGVKTVKTLSLIFNGSSVTRESCSCVVTGRGNLRVDAVEVRLRKTQSPTPQARECSSAVVHLNSYIHRCRYESTDSIFNTVLNDLYLNAAGEITAEPTNHQLSFDKEVSLTLNNLDGKTRDFPAMVWLMFSDPVYNEAVTVRCNKALDVEHSGGFNPAIVIGAMLGSTLLAFAFCYLVRRCRGNPSPVKDPETENSPDAAETVDNDEQLPEPVDNLSYVASPGDDTDENSTISPAAVDPTPDNDDADNDNGGGGNVTSGDQELVPTSAGKYNDMELKDKPIVFGPNYVRLYPRLSVDEVGSGEDYSHLAGFSAPSNPSGDAKVDTPFEKSANHNSKGDDSKDQYSHTHALGSLHPGQSVEGNDCFILEKTDDNAMHQTKEMPIDAGGFQGYTPADASCFQGYTPPDTAGFHGYTPIDDGGFQGYTAIRSGTDTGDYYFDAAADTVAKQPDTHVDM